MRLIRLIGLLILLIIGVSFACLNANAVEINYYIGTHSFPLVVLLLIAFGVGILLGAFLLFGRVCSLKRSQMKLKKRLRLMEKEKGI